MILPLYPLKKKLDPNFDYNSNSPLAVFYPHITKCTSYIKGCWKKWRNKTFLSQDYQLKVKLLILMSLVYLYLYCLLVQTISYRLVLYILSCTPKQLRKPKRYSRATMAQRHGNWQDRASKTGSESSIGVAVTNSQSYSYKTNMVVCSRLWVQGERKFTCHTVEIT